MTESLENIKSLKKYFPLLCKNENFVKGLQIIFPKNFKEIIEKLELGQSLNQMELYAVYLLEFLVNQKSVKVKSLIGRGGDGEQLSLSIMNYGPVYFLRGNEFEDVGYFSSVEDAFSYARRKFSDLISTSDNNAEFKDEGVKQLSNLSDADMKLFAEHILNVAKNMDAWKKLIGTLCFNIWHSTNEDFLNSNELVDMEIPFLCSFSIFQRWESVYLSKLNDINTISKNASEYVLLEKSKMFKQTDAIKSGVQLVSSKNKIEPLKVFITIFTEAFSKSYLRKFNNNFNPLDFFQNGLEVLFLFAIDLKKIDPVFFNDLLNPGEYESDVMGIINQINDLQRK